MTMPPVFCANSSARADLPLAVGPAISTALLKLSEFACMSLVATLICNPANPALDTTIVDGALAVLPSPGTAQWLFDEVAVDIPFDYQVKSPDDIKAIETRLQAARGDLPIDIVVQPVAVTAQEAFSGGHGFHHDRPGMHRRAGRFRRAEGACRRNHRAGDARRNRIRAGAARARRAA